MNTALLIGNILAFFGMAAGIYYLLASRRIDTAAETSDSVSRQFIRIIRRRRFGAALMVLIAVMFMVATNWFSDVHSIRMSIFWLLLMILLLWLLILAGLDLMAISRLRQEVINQADRKIKTMMGKRDEPAEPAEDETGDEENEDEDQN